MSISIEAHWQYIKDISWHSVDVLWSTISFVQSRTSAFLLESADFPPIQPQTVFRIYVVRIQLWVFAACKLPSQTKMACTLINTRPVIIEIIVRLSSRGLSQSETSRIIEVSQGATENVLHSVCDTSFRTLWLCGCWLKMIISKEDCVLFRILKETVLSQQPWSGWSWSCAFKIVISIQRQLTAECDQHKCDTLHLGQLGESALPQKGDPDWTKVMVDHKILSKGRERSFIYSPLDTNREFHHLWGQIVALVKWFHRIDRQCMWNIIHDHLESHDHNTHAHIVHLAKIIHTIWTIDILE